MKNHLHTVFQFMKCNTVFVCLQTNKQTKEMAQKAVSHFSIFLNELHRQETLFQGLMRSLKVEKF